MTEILKDIAEEGRKQTSLLRDILAAVENTPELTREEFENNTNFNVALPEDLARRALAAAREIEEYCAITSCVRCPFFSDGNCMFASRATYPQKWRV